jgi:hypothetical protein
VVRDPKTQDELIERAAPSEKRRARRRSLVSPHTAIAIPDVARVIVVRADADFERIFGSDD